MRNITVSVDDGVYRRARLFAAKLDTSVSRVVAELLEFMPQFKRLEEETLAAAAAKANALAKASTKKSS